MMPDCCSTTRDGACAVATGKSRNCPSCGKKGKPVSVLTVKNLIRDHTRAQASASYWFCARRVVTWSIFPMDASSANQILEYG